MVYVCWNRKPEVVSHRMPYRFSTLKLSCRLQVSTSTAGYSSTQPGGANEAMSRSTRPAAHAPPSPPRPAATCPNVSDVSRSRDQMAAESFHVLLSTHLLLESAVY